MTSITLHCKRCGRPPAAIGEYIDAAEANQTTPEDYLLDEEGTLDRSTGEFWCTECYIAIGMPLGLASGRPKNRHTVPPLPGTMFAWCSQCSLLGGCYFQHGPELDGPMFLDPTCPDGPA